MTMEARILVVDDDAGVREVLGFQLRAVGYRVTVAEDGAAARSLIEASGEGFHLVVADVRMPGMDGIELLRWVKGNAPGTEVVLVSAFGEVEKAVEAMRVGALDYLVKPVKRGELEARIRHALERVALVRENQQLRRRLGNGPLDQLVGVSEPIQALKDLVRRVAPSNAAVLILGESGTGKELVARALHELSDRASGPFVTINCGAIPADLLESELFGHEKGSFTGAVRDQVGRFERANGGTLLLDEVAELRPDHQVKLLRVLQERLIERVGGRGTIPVDVRVVAATHRDLRSEVRGGRFRDDLYYRLAVVPIDVPPLRDRPGDVVVLSRHFLSGCAVSLTPDLEAKLAAWPWPGNVRELQNVIERMALLRSSDQLTVADFRPDSVGDLAPVRLTPGHVRLPDEPFSLPELTREIVLKAIERFDGNQSGTARYLGIPRHVLLYRLDKYGVGAASGRSS